MSQSPISPKLRSWAEVNSEALRHNLALVRRTVGPGPGILAVVKANAYGHGTEPVARVLAGDVAIFGVANLSEAHAVKSAGTGRDIMLLSPCLPSERAEAVESGFIVTVSSAAEAEAYAAKVRQVVTEANLMEGQDFFVPDGLSPDDLPALYAGAAACACLSRSGSQPSRTALESMLYRLPLICGAIPCHVELAGTDDEVALTVPTDDPSAVADAIKHLRRDLAERPGFDLRAFHDQLLSFGSVPVALVAEAMRREAGTADE